MFVVYSGKDKAQNAEARVAVYSVVPKGFFTDYKMNNIGENSKKHL